jgi:hypothetical protein
MKKILFLLGLSLLVATVQSCGSSEESETETSQKEVDLVGEWRAIENSEADEPMQSIEQEVYIGFTQDMQWEMIFEGTRIIGGEYELQAGTVYCYVKDKKPEDPQQYVWEYYYEGDHMVLDGYYFKGNDKVNLKIVTVAK